MSKHNGNFEVYGDLVVGANISGSKYVFPNAKGTTGESLVMVGDDLVFTNVAPYIDIAQTSGGAQLVQDVNQLLSTILEVSGSIDNFAELFDTPKPPSLINAHEGEIIIVDTNASSQTQKIAYSGVTIDDIFNYIDGNVSGANLQYVKTSGDTMAGQLAGISGSASIPSFAFDGDTNTGFFNPTSDTIGISTNGTENVRIFPDGGVQVGGPFTTSPGFGNIQSINDVIAERNGQFGSVTVGNGTNGNSTTVCVGGGTNARSNDTIIGSTAGANISASGSINNTFVGYAAGNQNTTGARNTAIGSSAGFSNTGGSGNIFLGYTSGQFATSSNELYIDNQSRGTNTEEKFQSLVYGIFDADSVDQTLRINGKLNVNINTATAINAPPTNSAIHAVSPNSTNGVVICDTHGTSVNTSFVGRRSRGTAQSPTAVQTGDILVSLDGYGRHSSGWGTVGRGGVSAQAAESWTSTAQGTRVSINTTNINTTNTTEKVRVWSDGGVQIGGEFTTSIGVGNLQVAGISGNNGSIVTHDANGRLLDSGILATSLATTSTVASISGDLQGQINSINIVAGSNVTVVESPLNTWTISTSGGSGFTPLQGVGMNITPVGANYSFAVADYIGKTEVASISASLQSQITSPTSASLSFYDDRYVNVTGDTMTGQLAGISGSASNPSFTFTGDFDTGIFSAAPNTFSVGTGGTERVRVYDDGGVRIGGTQGTSPGNSRFMVVSNNATPAYSTFFTSAPIAQFVTNDGGRAGISLFNQNTGSSADIRMTLMEAQSDRGYMTLVMPSQTNTDQLFGINRGQLSALFLHNLGGYVRSLGIGTVTSGHVIIATNSVERMRVWNGGGVQIGGNYTSDVGLGNLQVAGISGNNGSIVTHDANGRLLDSGILATSLATTSTVASISGSLQSQISAITVPTSATFLTDYDNRYVNVTGNETVAGIKSFTSPIISYRGTTDGAVVIGKNAGSAAIDTGHVVIGSGAGSALTTPTGGPDAFKTNVLIGRNAGNTIAGGFDNVLIGDNVSVDISGATDAVVIGADSSGTSTSAIVGSLNVASAGNSVVVGYASYVSSSRGIAIGYATGIDTNSSDSIAIGCQNSIAGDNSIAIGYFSYTAADNGIAIGDGAGSDFVNSIAIGKNAVTTKAYQVMLGGSDITETVLRGNVKIPYATVDSISGASGNIVTHDAAGRLLDSGILATSLATTASIPTSATFLADYDNRYVNVSGDTMTGTLFTPTISASSLFVGSSTLSTNTSPFSQTTGQFIVNNGGTVGIGMRNTNGAGDYRLAIWSSGNTANYVAFSMPGDTNVESNLLGQSRNSSAFLFTQGSKKLSIGTIAAQDVVLGTNNTERMKIYSDGGVQIGDNNSSPGVGNLAIVSGNFLVKESAVTTTTPSATIHAIRNTNCGVRLDTYSISGAAFPGLSLYKARGTNAVPAAVQTDDVLGFVGAHGYGTTEFSSTSRAKIEFVASNTFTDSNQGTYMGFFTTSNNSIVTSERMRLWNDGGVQIGGTYTASPGAGCLAANGTIYTYTDTLTDATTINYSAIDSDNFTLLLTSAISGSRTLATPTNIVSGMRWMIRVKQPSSGGPSALSFSSAYKFPFGQTPTLSTAANAVDTISCFYDGTDILSQVINSYGTVSGINIAGNTLNLTGSVNKPNNLITTSTLLDETHHTVAVNVSGGSITITLPNTAVTSVRGRMYIVKKVDSSGNAVTVQRSGSDLIDGATSVSISGQYQVLRVHARSSGGTWDVI